MSSLLDAALRYAARGWPVFPLIPGRKDPLVKGAFHAAVTDAATIIEWWEKEPRANIGLATGARSGVDVLDVDPKNGGDATLTEVLDEHRGVIETASVRTPSRGLHFYFLHHDGLGRRIEALPGLDVLGDNGYVVVPPSVVDGKGPYEPVDRRPVAPWPAWLLAILAPPQKPSATNPYRHKGLPAGQATAYGASALRRSAEKVATAGAGGRNRELHFAAYSLARVVAAGHLSPDAVRAELLDAARANGYAQDEGEEKVRKVIEASMAKGAEAGPRGPSTAWACRP